MKTTQQEKQIKTFEKEKDYNAETIDINKCHYDEIDDDFDYFKYGFFASLLGLVVKGIIKVIIAPMDKCLYHLKIEGKENLKKVKQTGVIGIANHSQYADFFISKRVFYNKKYYITGAIFNNKKGFGGNFLRSLGMLPMSRRVSTTGQKKLDLAIEKILSKNQVVMFHPEKAMWKNYKKPRPFYRGAFYYAVKNNVPVLPLIVLYRKTNKWDKFWGRKNKLTCKILPPIYPKQNLSERDNIEYMRQKAQFVFNQAYKDFYGEENDAVVAFDPDAMDA